MGAQQICQSCGMPITSFRFMGTEINGALNHNYCINCYQHGEFTRPDMSLGDMRAHVRVQMRKMNWDPGAIERTVSNLPELKRWKAYAVSS